MPSTCTRRSAPRRVLLGLVASLVAAPVLAQPRRASALITVSGGGAERARELLPQAIEVVESRLGAVDWSGTTIVLTTSQREARSSPAPEWAAGYAFPARRHVVIRTDRVGMYPYSTLRQVLIHELAHLAIHQREGEGEVPRWFNEGLAMSIAGEMKTNDAYHLSLALVFGPRVTVESIDRGFYAGRRDAQSAYALARSFVGWLESEYDVDIGRRVLERVHDGDFFERALERDTRATLLGLEQTWYRHAVIYFKWIPIVTSTTTMWLLISLLTVLAFIRKRQRVQAIRERWALEDGELSEVDISGPYGPN